MTDSMMISIFFPLLCIAFLAAIYRESPSCSSPAYLRVTWRDVAVGVAFFVCVLLGIPLLRWIFFVIEKSG